MSDIYLPIRYYNSLIPKSGGTYAPTLFNTIVRLMFEQYIYHSGRKTLFPNIVIIVNYPAVKLGIVG